MVSRDERRIARELVDAKRAREGSRTRQIPHTSVELDNGESAGLVDAATDAADARALSEVQSDQLGDLTDISDTSTVEATFLPERLAPGAGSSKAAFDVAVEAAVRVYEALAEARQAIEDAANALTTSNGKNSRRRGQTEPEPPEGGWVQGDQWVVNNAAGEAVEVRVWDGTEFVHETILTGELLVLSSGGVVRLADGVVTADAIAADAIDGMVITGALIRTAASGQRLQFDANGLRSFDTDGLQTASLTAYDGGINLAGVMKLASLSGAVPRTLIARNAFSIENGEDVAGTPRRRSIVFEDSVSAEYRTAGSSPENMGAAVSQLQVWDDQSTVQATFRPPNSPGFNETRAQLLAMGDRATLLLYGIDGAYTQFEQRSGGELTVSGSGGGSKIKFQAPVSFQGDTEWVTIPLASGFMPYNDRPPMYKVKAGVLYTKGAVRKTSGNFDTSASVFSLPNGIPNLSGVRDSWDTMRVVTSAAGVSPGRFYIQADGAMVIAAISGIAAYYTLSASFPLD